MNFEVETIQPCDESAKRLAKKHPFLKSDLAQLMHHLETEPFTGTPIGKSCYKIRLAIASKGGGKSGGARVISFVAVLGAKVYLLALYDKSEQQTISNEEIVELLTFVTLLP